MDLACWVLVHEASCSSFREVPQRVCSEYPRLVVVMTTLSTASDIFVGGLKPLSHCMAAGVSRTGPLLLRLSKCARPSGSR